MTDRTGCYTPDDSGSWWIETWSGGMLCLNDPKVEQIRLDDIAQGLSNTCRFAGQCSRFYSVAEHSVLVMRELSTWAKEHMDCSQRRSLLIAALLHDASEAYIGDVTRPLKQMLPKYMAIEQRLQKTICDRFGIPALSPDEFGVIKRTDNALLRRESLTLMVSGGRDWEFGDTPVAVNQLLFLTPNEAFDEFKLECNKLELA